MKVFFAGFETVVASYTVFEKPTDDIFATYFYRNKTNALFERVSKAKGHQGLIVIDSGAHSFFGYTGTSTAAHHNNKKVKDMPDPNKYLADYVDWIEENYDHADYFVELDIQSIVGLEQVKKWREIYKSRNIAKKIIKVMHRCDSWDDFEKMVNESESGYIGLEGLSAKKINLPYMKMLNYCYKKNVKVHGFALTASDITLNYPFYSVDSTTWTAPVRYGTFLVLENGSLKQKKPDKNNLLKYKLPIELITKNLTLEGSNIKLGLSMEAQRKYGEYLTEYWRKRGVLWQ